MAMAESKTLTVSIERRPGMTDEKFAADAQWVIRDLNRLRELLEAA